MTTFSHAQGPETVYRPEGTKFTVFAPANASQVVLRLYKDGIGGKAIKTIKMKRDTTKPSHWTTYVKGDQKGRFYTFEVGKSGKETP